MSEYGDLTRPQRRILDEYRGRADAGLAPPTYRELCRKFGWRSTGTARDHLKALISKGALDSGLRRARGTHLHRESAAASIILPLVGRIVAGRPVVSDELVEGEIAVPAFLAPRGKGFLLRVSGDSMEDAGILEGDFVVMREANDPNSGDIVAATVSGETTLKRLEKRGRAWMLVPENQRYKPIEIASEDVRIHGVVVAVLRAVSP